MRNLWGDLKSTRLMYLKAVLFLLAGTAASLGILAESPSLRTAFLLGLAIWSFCRLYYFAFYVIEKYIDPGYRFAGLTSFLLYLLRDRTRNEPRSDQREVWRQLDAMRGRLSESEGNLTDTLVQAREEEDASP